MLDKRIKKALLVICFLLFILEAEFASALKPPEVQYPKIPLSNVETPNVFIKKINDGAYPPGDALGLYVRYIYSLVLTIAGMVAFGIVIYGGLQYLISTGNPGRITAARDQISSGILGLIILFSSYLILTVINPKLAVLPSITLNKAAPPEITAPPITESEGTLLFQVPTGRIIERTFLDAEGQRNINAVKAAAKETKEESERLKNLTQELKDITNSCACGSSQCSGPADCAGISCNDSICDIEAINAKKAQVQTSINALKNKEPQISTALQSLTDDYLEFKRAGLLMSVPLGVMDYNSMLGYRYYLEKMGQEVQIVSDGFAKWDDNQTTINGRKIADPATFYFNKKNIGNEQAIAQAQALSVNLDAPFLIGPPPTIIPPPSGPVITSLPSGPPSSRRCEAPPTEGPCSVENLTQVFGNAAWQASRICKTESGANIYSLNTDCEAGLSGDYSVGLFQINLTPRCPGGFIYPYGTLPNGKPNYNRCLVINPDKVNECKNTYGYGNLYQNNIMKARDISSGGSYWCPWSTACPQYCNFCNNSSYVNQWCGGL